MATRQESAVWQFDGGILTNTVGEVTAAAGVTIDGVVLKDNCVFAPSCVCSPYIYGSTLVCGGNVCATSCFLGTYWYNSGSAMCVLGDLCLFNGATYYTLCACKGSFCYTVDTCYLCIDCMGAKTAMCIYVWSTMCVSGCMDAYCYYVGGNVGYSYFSGSPSSITVCNGLVTSIS